MAIKITDLVDPAEIQKLKDLDAELKNVLSTYTDVAKDLAKGIDIKVSVAGDIERVEKLLVDKGKEAAEAQKNLTRVVEEQGRVIANTTNTISRQLMEQERVNKTQRESYTEHEKVKRLLDQYHDTYEGQLQSLVKINRELKQNREAQKENEKALSMGRVSMAKFTATQTELIAQHRSLTQEKRTLTQIMTAEEKAAQSQEGSYVHMSQQLELLKKAYKDLSEEGRSTDFGRELEASIQNLDAHLKDVAADMGEFQRNVGNYAIAGQQGVVATESVIAAMNQEARTTQDLIDQTKILEEAKLMLNKEDANYQSTLDSLNAKIEENKRKLTDVGDILGKEARSVSEAEAQNKRLSEAIKHIDLTSVDAKKRLEEMRSQIERNNQTIAEATGDNEKFADSLLGILGVNANLGSSFQSLNQNGNFLDGLNTKTKAFTQTLMGLLANPWVLSFLGIAGIVAGFKWWYDYNKGLIEASRLTENFTGLTENAADKITTDTQAIAEHMGKGFDDTIGAANTLVQQFGITWEEALAKIEDGIEAGADMNGKLVDNINQFAPALRDAGVSVDEFVSILAETRNGIFDEKGVQDIIKGGTRLRAMTKQIAESLDACGISSKQMQEDLANGNITMLEAVQQVSAKLKELPENSQEAGLVMKNVFGRTAAEGGTLLVQSLADVNTNLDEAKKRMGDLGKLNREQMEAQKELNEVLASVFKMSGTNFEQMTIQAKTYIVQGLTKIIKGCIDIVNWFIRMYNQSLPFRASIEYIAASFKQVWEAAKFLFNYLIEGFKNVGKMLESIFTFDFTSPTESFKKIMDTVKEGYASLGKQWKGFLDNSLGNFKTAIHNATDGVQIEEIKIGYDKVDTSGADAGYGAGKRNVNGISSNSSKGSDDEKKSQDNAAKEAEKRAKEELKRIYELEESKLAMMADGHEKELAMIRMKFKKKIDEIKGQGATEIALRVQLAEQCQKEINDCELKYQTELAKINRENRLAVAREGSKEELDLKMEQIEASRAAELKAAEKTGADINLINAKFNKERQKLEEEYANACASAVEKRYYNEQTMADNAHIRAVAALQMRYAEEMKLAQGNIEEQELIRKRFEEEKERLDTDYARQTIRTTISMLEEILKNEQLSAEDRLKYEQALAKAKADLEGQMADEAEANIKKITDTDNAAAERRIQNSQRWLQVASDALNQIGELINATYDAQITRIEEEQEISEEAKDKEIERITELVERKVISEEEGEARKRAAEAQTAKKNEELEKKKQQLKYRQARWDKANGIAQAGIATALAIMNALQMKPFPLGIAMAAIAGAMGAIQIATIMATPIPKYAKGTDNHKGGPAIVGDGGVPELVIFGDRTWISPDKPTLVDLPAGAMVIPKVDGVDSNIAGHVPGFAAFDRSNVVVNNDYKRLEDKMDSFIHVLKKHSLRQHRDSIGNSHNLYISEKV